MKQRCFTSTSIDYKNYGARGITICKEWNDFQTFINDMLPSYKQGLTLDRIDVNGNYEPSNCRWATKLEQNNNRRDNCKLTYDGRTMNLPEWARELNIKRSTLAQRLYVYKWPIEKCLKGGY